MINFILKVVLFLIKINKLAIFAILMLHQVILKMRVIAFAPSAIAY